MGTPGYMSPEQVKGEEVDHRTDIFSCGVLLYELLTGKKAFSGPSLTAVLYRVVNEELPPLRELDPSLPPHLEGIVRRATEKDPARRYPEASLMARDLREGAFTPAQETVLLSPPSALTMHLSPPPSTLVRPPGELPASPLPEALPSPRRRTSLWVLISALASLLIIGGGVLSFLLLSSSRVTVPDVVGLDVEEARSVITKRGLKVIEDSVDVPGFEKGEVVSQVPAAGERVPKRKTVSVDVASGKGADIQGTVASSGMTIGTAMDGLRIVDLRHADHGNFYRVVFELAATGGGQATGCPLTKAEWRQESSGIRVDIQGIREVADSPAEGGSESTRDPVVLRIDRLPGSGSTASYLIVLSGAKPFNLFSVPNPVRIVIDIAKNR